MAKINYAKCAGKPVDDSKRSEAQILGKTSEESLKELRKIASEHARKQGKINVNAGEIVIGSMKDKES